MGDPQPGGFIMENPIKMDDLGDPPISGNVMKCVRRYQAQHVHGPSHLWIIGPFQDLVFGGRCNLGVTIFKL